jgi:hypothetical protein
VGELAQTDTGELFIEVRSDVFAIVIQPQRDTHLDHDVEIIRVVEEAVVPWSGTALAQFALMSWNPMFWAFASLWSETGHSDHPALRDWVLLWNPFIRTGAPDRAEIRERRNPVRVEHRRLSHVRLPLLRTEVALELAAGPVTETLTEQTDDDGRITIPFDDLPAAFRSIRPIRIRAEVEGLEAAEAKIF